MLKEIKERFDYFNELDKASKQKHHVLYIEPDYDALIWEEDTVIYGAESDGFQFLDSPMEQEEDDISLKDIKIEEDDDLTLVDIASSWISTFVHCCLIPVQTDQISREKLVKKFSWEYFHDEGIKIAKIIAAQLPDNCELWYTTPWEDSSKSIPEAILIKEAK